MAQNDFDLLELMRKWNVKFPFSDSDNAKADTAEEAPAPTLEDMSKALGESLSENGYRETEKSMADAANDRMEEGDAARAEAKTRADELYGMILSYAGKQDGRYDELIREIAEGDYRNSKGAQAILSEYERDGKNAQEHSLADGAAANGGNPDSYAAAQAARSRLAMTEAGEKAARTYYGEQLDRLLKAITSSGADMDSLYRRMQDHIDGQNEAAGDDLSIGADLLSELASLQNDRRTDDIKELSSLLSRAEETKNTPTVSPMEVDREYDALTDPKGEHALTAVEALIRLWRKYPSMQEHLLQKYKDILVPPYEFTP